MTFPTATPSSSAARLWLFILQQRVRFSNINVTRLRHRNLLNCDSVVAPEGPIVSINSDGRNLDTVYLTLESIAAGKVLPSRLILWIQDAENFNSRPSSLIRLEDRGLEVRLVKDYNSESDSRSYGLSLDDLQYPLVTASADILYNRQWLADLVKAHQRNPQMINCYSAHVVPVMHGKIGAYLNWQPCESTEPSFQHVATGASGCIYPMEYLQQLQLSGSQALENLLCAKDIWLHANALRAGFKVKQIGQLSKIFQFMTGIKADELSGLENDFRNVDENIQRTYTASDISLLTAAMESKK
jgi:hypothetical protein